MRSMGFPTVELPALAHQVSDEASIVRLFDDCARQFPGRTAIVCGDARVTYAELDARSTTVAAILRALGAREDEPVALLADPSVEMVVAMLATIKAGCAYLPIDPGLPERRVAAILEDSRARFLLRATDRHAGLACAHVLDLRGALDTARAIERLDVVGDLAYIIYTSGTTGTPKGVMVRQRSLVNYVLWFRATYGIDRRAVAPLLTSYAFDLGYTSLWTTLLSGGEVHLLRDELITDMTRLLAYFRAHQVTFVKLTPSLFHAIVHSQAFAASDSCASLRIVVSGGETIRCEDLRRYYERYPDTLIVNHYGPTETTIGVCTMPIPPRELDAFARRPVIGRPIGGVSACIVDANLRPLEVGEVGELVIAGVSVARGYLYKDQLTAERFIADPTGSAERAYRTGDLARWTPDGTIEFLGRMDRQVKVNGFRIELPEIESKLREVRGVTAAVVMPVWTKRQTQQLCAYLVSNVPIDAVAVRDELAAQLPHYMVPPLIMQLDALPVTANGKLDVGALPEPGAAPPAPPPAAPSQAVAETTALRDIERELAGAWELAGLGADEPDANFFMLGGDSIGAAMIASMVQKKFDIALSAKVIYENPTLGAQALVVQRALASKCASEAGAAAPFVAIRHELAAYPQSHEQALFIHHFELNPVAHCGSLNLRLRGEIDVEHLRQAVETIVHRHEPLRTVFPRRAGAPIAQVVPPARVELRTHDVRHVPADDQDAAVCQLARELLVTPFDLARGPMLRPVLVQRGARDHHLILSYCHVNIDRWSIVILLHEVLDLYCALRTATPSRLPELKVQYSDYATWLASRANSPAVAASLEDWHALFERAPVQRSLAVGPSALVSGLGECAPHFYTLSSEQLRRLEAVCKAANCSVPTALLIAYGVALERYLGAGVLIDTFMTSATRGEPEMTPLIAALADVRPLLFETRGHDFWALSKQITSQLIAAKESLTPGIALRTAPTFERSRYGFNFRANVPPRASHQLPGVATPFHYGPGSLFTRIELPELGLTVEPITYPSATRRFTGDQDVYLGINEIDGQLSCVFWFLLSKRFESPTPEQFVASFAANLGAILDRPDARCETWQGDCA